MTVTEQDLLNFSVNHLLGRSRQVFLLIKGFDQKAVVDRIIQRKGQRRFGLTAAEHPADRQYSTGNIVAANLDCDRFSNDTLTESDLRLESVEPFGVAFSGETVAYTSGSELRLLDLRTGNLRIFSHDWLSFAHTIEYSPNGRSILTSSAGFDTVLEFDVDSGVVRWEWNAWDHGFIKVPSSDSYVTRSERKAASLREQGHEVTLVRDPADWPPEGIPTVDSPGRLNGASYDLDNRILVTFYHRPELAIVARDGSYTQWNLELLHAHGLQRTTLLGKDVYLVTNSGAGELLVLDPTFKVTQKLIFTSLPADRRKTQGFGEWIQTINVLDASRGLLAAVDALRDGVHIIDLQARTRRFVPYPPAWRLHAVINLPKELGLHQAAMSGQSQAFYE